MSEACYDFPPVHRGQSHYVLIFHSIQAGLFPLVLDSWLIVHSSSGFIHSVLGKVNFKQQVRYNDSVLSQSGFLCLLE